MTEERGKYGSTFEGVVKIVIIALMLLFIAVLSFLYSPFVQKKVVHWASEFAHEKWGVKVSVDEIRFRPFNKLYLKGFLLSNDEVDSLVYISEGELAFDANPLKLLRKELTLSRVDADQVKIRVLPDYTPSLPDTARTDGSGFNFIFGPVQIDVDGVDFALRDTVTGKAVEVLSGRVTGKMDACNFKNEFSLKDVDVDRPRVSVYTARWLEKDNPYIVEMKKNFRLEHGIDTNLIVSDSLFWKLDFNLENVAINDGSVHVFKYNPDTERYRQEVTVGGITGKLDRGESRDNYAEVQGFEVKLNLGDTLRTSYLTLDKITLNEKALQLDGLNLDYHKSVITGEARLGYEKISDLLSLLDKVETDVLVENGEVYMEDLLEIIPGLGRIDFFRENRRDTYSVSLQGHGSLSNLALSRFELKNGRAHVTGTGSWKNLFEENARTLSVNIQRGYLPTRFIKQKLPDIDFPEGLDSLVYVDVRGRADLVRGTWSINGGARTRLGKISLESMIDTRGEKFHGKIGIESFDLGRFLKNPNMGSFSMRIEIEEGDKFDINELSGHLNTTVDSFYFKDYVYRDLKMYGFFGNSSFLGHIAMDQPELAFDLDTKIDFNNLSDIVAYGNVHHAHLQDINLINQNLKIRGEVDVEMNVFPIDSLNGYARFNGVTVTRNDTVDYKMNVITMDARSWGDNYKDWKLKSDILSVVVDGQFNIANILGTTYEIMKSRHPRLMSYLPDFNLSTDTIYNNDFTLIVDVNDTEEFSQLIHPDLDTIRNLNLSLTYRNRGWEYFEYYFQSSAPKIQYKNVGVESLNINASGNNTDNEWIVYLDSLSSGSAYVSGLRLNTKLIGNQLDFSIESETINNILNGFNVAGSNTFLGEEGMQLALDSSSFTLLDNKWTLNENNSVLIGKQKLFFDQFVYASGSKNIYVQSATDQALVAGIENIDIRFLDAFFPGGKFSFRGQSNLVLSVENVFDLTGLEVEAVVDDLVINKEPFGRFRTLFYTLGVNQLANVSIDVVKDNIRTLAIQGDYDLFNQAQNQVPVFDFSARANQFPVLVLEFFLSDIIENTTGYASAEIQMKSDGIRPDIGGRVLINGQTRIPILGTTYDFVNSAVNIDNQLIDFAQINMMDKEGNVAHASGGIRHDHLSEFRMNTQVSTEKFLLLNTQKMDGTPFYGRGIGSATINISGPFNQLNMVVNAKTGPTSQISIPISSTISVDNREAFFIDFITDGTFDEETGESQREFAQIEGLNLEVNLTMTPDAQVSIILDESTGDILRARGYSELQIELTRAGNFTIRGTYEVFSGEYQFAQLNFARKMFKINQGGTITWTGDPMNAKIDVDASYSVRTPPYNFILEYIGQNQRLAELAENATDVDLFLHLRGDLFEPDISFDMEFPELTGQVKNYVEDRLRVIADDQNEINKQVFGLLVARSFIPSVSSVVNIDGTVVNTVSEVITNQISFFLTQYLQESIDDMPFISSVELNVGYNVYRNNYSADAQNVVKTGNEFLVQPEFGFLDNRLQLRTEANLQTGTAVTSNTLITHDFVLEYSITSDNRLVGKLYQRTEPYVFEKTSKLGIGLSYKQEFDSFYEFLRGKNRSQM